MLKNTDKISIDELYEINKKVYFAQVFFKVRIQHRSFNRITDAFPIRTKLLIDNTIVDIAETKFQLVILFLLS